MTEFGSRTGENQLPAPVQLPDDAEDIYRKEESVFRMNPAITDRGSLIALAARPLLLLHQPIRLNRLAEDWPDSQYWRSLWGADDLRSTRIDHRTGIIHPNKPEVRYALRNFLFILGADPENVIRRRKLSPPLPTAKRFRIQVAGETKTDVRFWLLVADSLPVFLPMGSVRSANG